MKFFPAQYFTFLRERVGHQNLRLGVRFLVILVIMTTAYTVIFHILMAREGQYHTWLTGLYWTLTVMSTLGFGDITFHTDVGRLFSIGVLMSGMIFLLILLPFTFIEFFYEPWMKARSAARAPRLLPPNTRDHVVITHYDEVTHSLISKLNQYHYNYVLLVPDPADALNLHDQGFKVIVGDVDNPETYRCLRVDQAAMVANTSSDAINTNVAFTVRQISETVPIISTADSPASVDILELAGSNYVLQIGEMMGQALARLTIGGDGISHVIGGFEDLVFAEANVAGTPLVGKTLGEIRLGELVGIRVIGMWQRGKFETARPETPLTVNMILVLMGTQAQLDAYDELFAIYHVTEAPILILGSGRVGRATARGLEERGLDYRIVEQKPDNILDDPRYILGDAADLETLKKAGIMESPTVIITTHDDDINVYLTIYCRRLRPDMQIITRTMRERNVETLHRAGADFVMSYASTGANAIFRPLEGSDVLIITEGLNLFRLDLPVDLAARTIAETAIPRETGCYIVAVFANNTMHVNPAASMRLPAESEIILIGSMEAEKKFLERYGGSRYKS